MKNIILLIIIFIAFSCQGQEEKKEYSEFIKEIIAKRYSFKVTYSTSHSKRRDSIILEARAYLINTMTTDLFPYWYGTAWEFNGTTRIPQEGKIACGYFVTNILTDVGFKIPRVKWAQSASEVFIKKLSYSNIKRFSNKPISTVEDYLVNAGNGLYVVGLDSHTGFISVDNNVVRFIHADYYEPEKGVVSEKLDSESPIKDSSYRVIGKLMSDEMIVHWINNDVIK